MHTHGSVSAVSRWRCWAGTYTLALPPARLRDGCPLLPNILHRPRPPHGSPGGAQQHQQQLCSSHHRACGGSCNLSQLPAASHMQRWGGS